MNNLTIQEKLQKINEWLRKQKPNLEELKENSILVTYWEDGEDEVSAGIGNASYSSGYRYAKLSKEANGKTYILPCDSNGVMQETNLKDYMCLEEMTMSDIKHLFEDDIMEYTSIKN